jgi:hypothetical protein
LSSTASPTTTAGSHINAIAAAVALRGSHGGHVTLAGRLVSSNVTATVGTSARAAVLADKSV